MASADVKTFVGCLGFVMHLLSVGKCAASKGATLLKADAPKHANRLGSKIIKCNL
jgi:hypothetical protein